MKKLTNSEEDQKIIAVLQMLETSGLIEKYQGACTSASKILYSLLLQNGIKSKVAICSCMIRLHEPNKPQQLVVIGFAETGIIKPTEEDLHAVVITDTLTPWLIDTSIGKWLPTEEKIICEPSNENGFHLGNFSNPLYSITYTKRSLTYDD